MQHHRLLQSTNPSLVVILLLHTHFKINLRYPTMNSQPTPSLITCLLNTIIIAIRRVDTQVSMGDLPLFPDSGIPPSHHHFKQQIIRIRIITYQHLPSGHNMRPYHTEATCLQDNRRSPVSMVPRQIDTIITTILKM